MALVLPGASSAAPPPPPPTQDSVVLTGGPAIGTYFTVLALDARSGPSGENPTGQVEFDLDLGFGRPVRFQGPVTCLAVNGSAATINIQNQTQLLFGDILTVQVVDNHPDSFDAPAVGRALTDCSPAAPSSFGGPLSGRDITVVDAQPPPSSKDECKNDGWTQFGFANQGQCVAFVNHGQ